MTTGIPAPAKIEIVTKEKRTPKMMRTLIRYKSPTSGPNFAERT
jgi:hypothetical protein